MADVDVPGIGNLDKRYVIAGTGIAGAYVAYRWWKSRQAPATQAPAAASDTTAPPTDLGTGTDAYTNPAGGTGGALYNSGSASGTAPSTDQAWTAAVVSDLSNQGYNPQTVAEALANYLARQPLTSDQVTIVRLAWAFEGRPPGEPSLAIVQSGGGTGPGQPTPPPITGGTPPPYVPGVPADPVTGFPTWPPPGYTGPLAPPYSGTGQPPAGGYPVLPGGGSGTPPIYHPPAPLPIQGGNPPTAHH